MNCDEARELLLEAELVELRGEGDSPLARHVTACAGCRAMAAHILSQTAALHAALERRPAAKRRFAWRRAVPVGLAAAAALALLLVPRTKETRVLPAAAVAPHEGVVATASNVAVIQTQNPKITVVWYF